MYRNFGRIILLMGCCWVGDVLGQGILSPYSELGIGETHTKASVQNRALAGTGISQSNPIEINSLNPALMANNYYSTFALGMTIENKTIQTSTDKSPSIQGGNLQYIALSLPILKKELESGVSKTIWSSGINLFPSTYVNYKRTNEGTVLGNDTVKQITSVDGSGSINELAWSNGFRINDKLQVGFALSYAFGHIEDQRVTSLHNNSSVSQLLPIISQEISISGIKLQLGAAYHYPIEPGKKYLNLGLVYDFASDLSGHERRILGYIVPNTSLASSHDTTKLQKRILVPSEISFGVSYEIFLKLLFQLDFQYSNWTDFSISREFQDPLGVNYKIAASAQWIPNAESFNYFLRLPIRGGFYYEKTPFELNEQIVANYGLSFGTSLLISAGQERKAPGTIDLAFSWGRIGSIKNGLIQENYFQIHIGATFNDRWFIRRKYY